VYQARYLAKKIAPYNIGFFEEPLRANDTHRLAAKTFVGAAVVGLVLTLLPLPLPAVTITTVVVIFVGALSPVVYSLVIYKRLERAGQLTLDP